MIFLRNVSVGDKEILTEIHRSSFSEWWSSSSFQNMLMDPSYFGILVGKEINSKKNIYGFILSRKIFDEVEIITLCVRPEHRRSGFGKLLMLENIRQVVSAASNDPDCAVKIFLEVADTNVAAIGLYNLLGFQNISKREKYYKKDGEQIDAHVMMLVVKNGEAEG